VVCTNVGCTGKTSVFGSHFLYTSALCYNTEDNKDGWIILQPAKEKWRFRNRKEHEARWNIKIKDIDYFPTYFPDFWSSERDGDSNNNFFYSIYTFDDNVELSLWIHNQSASKIERKVYLDFFGNPLTNTVPDEIHVNKFCEHINFQDVVIFFNTIDVEFDSGSVYIIKNGEKTNGMEISDEFTYSIFEESERCTPDRYNLALPETVQKKKPYNKIWDNRPNHPSRPKQGPFPVFRYRFPLTCRDLEDAVLVVDGLYRHGQRVPPLKVRMKYYDLDLVPEYVGPRPPPVRESKSWPRW
jgi:hypothetical protein